MANLTGFAEACYDTNSVRELLDALQEGGADSTSCADWKITAAESYAAMEEALACKISDDYSLFCEYIDPDATTAKSAFDAMTEDARIAMIREVLASNDSRR